MRRHEPNKPYRDERPRGYAGVAQGPESQKEMQAQLGEALLNAAQRGDAMSMEGLITAGASVNIQDKQTGATPLHFAAAYGARSALRVLLGTRRCDFLIRDKAGRLASEMAGLYAGDPAVAKLLRMKERAQADSEGVRLHRRNSTTA